MTFAGPVDFHIPHVHLDLPANTIFSNSRGPVLIHALHSQITEPVIFSMLGVLSLAVQLGESPDKPSLGWAQT